MNIVGANAARIEALSVLMDRLNAPDLALAEAALLRHRLVELLGPIDGASEPSRGGPGRSREIEPARLLACSAN